MFHIYSTDNAQHITVIFDNTEMGDRFYLYLKFQTDHNLDVSHFKDSVYILYYGQNWKEFRDNFNEFINNWVDLPVKRG